MARSAASARSSMLMVQIIASPRPQICTFATHVLHPPHRSFSMDGVESAPPTNEEEEHCDDTTSVATDNDAVLDRSDRRRGGDGGCTGVRAGPRRHAWRHAARR